MFNMNGKVRELNTVGSPYFPSKCKTLKFRLLNRIPKINIFKP